MDFDDEDGWGRPGFLLWAVSLGIMLLLSAVAYSWLPADARIPQQINASGSPINFESKAWVLFFLPGLLAGLGLVLDLVPFMPRPKREISELAKYLASLILLLAHIATVVTAFKWFET